MQLFYCICHTYYYHLYSSSIYHYLRMELCDDDCIKVVE